MKKILSIISLLLLVLCLPACNKGGDKGINRDCPDLAGIYEVTSGTQHIIDSQGVDQIDDLDGYGIAVAQSGCTLEFFDCMGPIDKDDTVKCDTDVYGSDPWFGPFYNNVQGKIVIEDDGSISAEIMLYATFPYADYDGTNEIILTAVFDKEATDRSKNGG